MTTTTSVHGGIDSEFSRAERLLVRRVESAVDRLNERLELVRSAHDLSWRGLLSEQRKVAPLHRAGVLISGDQFWHETAWPMTERLRAGSHAVIEEEFARIDDAVAHLLRAARSVDDTVTIPVMTAALLPARSVIFDHGPLDRIGEQWQRKLRTAAVRRIVVPLLISPASETRDRVLQSELKLLSNAPWLHGDRLLGAYESAHAEIRATLRDSVVTAMARRLDGADQNETSADVAADESTIAGR